MYDENNSKHPGIFFAIASMVVLGIIAIFNYNPDPEKVFSLDSFYKGTMGVEADPVKANRLTKGSNIFSVNACKTKCNAAAAIGCGRAIWVATYGVPSGEEEFSKLLASSDANGAIKPYSKGGHIVSPCNLEFINSNVSRNTDGTIDIIAYANSIGSQTVLKWSNVLCWWCHIGKDFPDQHTTVIGANGIYKTCVSGMIIGQATSDTTFEVFKIENGEYVNKSVYEWFFGE